MTRLLQDWASITPRRLPLDSYLILKLVHILCAVVVAGTGVGIAFFMFMVNRTRNIEAIAVTTRHVVLADWLFTLPAVILQFITGLLLMLKLGYSFTSTWFLMVLTLFIFIGICWIPVLFIQVRLRELAALSVNTGILDAGFTQLMKLWTRLGIPAFSAILIIFWLMVVKPLPVV
ncbi:MAG: hypothetical protein HW411_1704 [Gammaproteobacteria bacterium]|nr:hypothetical protein [Gammaproteobacteria bacterium]